MSGPEHRPTIEAVRAFWDEHAAARVKRGVVPYEMAPRRRELHTSKTRLVAYVSDGRWVADCPGGPDGNCGGGMAAWPEHEHACCLDCGTVYPIDFPHGQEIAEATEALDARLPMHRHWRPDRGETAEDLRVENVERGLAPRAKDDWRVQVAEATGTSPELVEQIAAEILRKRIGS